MTSPMIKTLTAAAIFAASSLSFAAIAQAQDSTFYAAPMNPGPPSMGMMMGQPAMAPMAPPMAERPMMHKPMMKRHMSKKQMMMMKKES